MKSPKQYTLNFHSIYNDKYSSHADTVFSLHENKLIEILEAVASINPSIRLTFDDGHLSDFKLVLPLLQKLNLDASFFVLGQSLIEDPEKFNQTLRIYEAGFTIGSHGYHHCDLTALTAEELDFEIKYSKKVVESCIGAEIDDFSLPYGKYNPEIIEKLRREGYQQIYTTQGFASSATDVFVHRINVKSNTNIWFLKKAVICQNPICLFVFRIRLGLKKMLGLCPC